MVIRKWIFSHFCNKSKQSVYAFSRSSDAYEMRRMENYNSFQLCEGEITQMTKGVRWDFIICWVLTKNRLAKLRLGDVEWRSWKIGYFVTARHYLCFVLAWCHVRQVNEVHFREENLKIFTLQKHCVRATEFHSKIHVFWHLRSFQKVYNCFIPIMIFNADTNPRSCLHIQYFFHSSHDTLVVVPKLKALEPHESIEIFMSWYMIQVKSEATLCLYSYRDHLSSLRISSFVNA